MKYPDIIQGWTRYLCLLLISCIFLPALPAQDKTTLEKNRQEIMDGIRQLGRLASDQNPDRSEISSAADRIERLLLKRDSMISGKLQRTDTINDSGTVNEPAISDLETARTAFSEWQRIYSEKHKEEPVSVSDHYKKFYRTYLEERLVSYFEQQAASEVASDLTHDIASEEGPWLSEEKNWSRILEEDFELTLAQVELPRSSPRRTAHSDTESAALNTNAQEPAYTPKEENPSKVPPAEPKLRIPGYASIISTHSGNHIALQSDERFENKQAFFKWPLNDVTVENYAEGIHIKSGSDNLVKAIEEGVVIRVGTAADDKVYIIIKHSENYHSVYGGMQFANVAAGDQVSEQQLIGLASTIGSKFSMHFEVRKGRASLTPRYWLKNR